MLSDESIAIALELRHGSGYRWKVIARMLGMDDKKLYNQVYKALRRGMRK